MVALAGSVNGLGGLLKKITVPVLVMHGDDDQIVPYANLVRCRQNS
jgi:pimeloyl-ACP methyl ester carboxylesterase